MDYNNHNNIAWVYGFKTVSEFRTSTTTVPLQLKWDTVGMFVVKMGFIRREVGWLAGGAQKLRNPGERANIANDANA